MRIAIRPSLVSPFLSWLYISFLLARCLTVTAFPSLSKRQGESLFDDFDAGGWFSDLAGPSSFILDGLWNYLVPPDKIPQDPNALPGQQNQDLPGTQNPESPVPDIELQVTGYSTPGDNCIPQPPNSDQRSTPLTNFDPCSFALARVIHPFDCETVDQSSDLIAAQCRAIEAALTEMVGPSGFQTYSRKCGIDFYTAPLTQTHVQMLQKISNPPIVESNPKGELFGNSVADAPEKFEIMQKRKQPSDLISQLNAWDDLVFVSTHPPRPQFPPVSLPAYYYYETSDSIQQSVLVYIVDTGASLQNSEFQRQYERNGQIINDNVIKQWIFVDGINPSLDDTNSYEGGPSSPARRQLGHGTCIAQKVAGLTKGVHKGAHLIIVKVSNYHPIADGLNALKKIIEDLEGRRNSGEDVRGHIVINMSVGWLDLEHENLRKLQERVNRLLTEFQAIVVVSAGQESSSNSKQSSPVKTWPALMGDMDYPIIVVGGVDPLNGHRIPQARHGPSVTVSAPYRVNCVSEEQTSSQEKLGQGTSFSAGIVTGVISAWLSDDELGPILRRDKVRIPKRVISLVGRLSYVREGGLDPSIWNGVIGNRPEVWPPTKY